MTNRDLSKALSCAFNNMMNDFCEITITPEFYFVAPMVICVFIIFCLAIWNMVVKEKWNAYKYFKEHPELLKSECIDVVQDIKPDNILLHKRAGGNVMSERELAEKMMLRRKKDVLYDRCPNCNATNTYKQKECCFCGTVLVIEDETTRFV